MEWVQRRIQLPAARKGLHPITHHICDALPELAEFEMGILHVFIQHTSASLTINEAADPDVPVDLDRLFDHVAPEAFAYRHTIEGPDDMPAHAKASLFGSSVSVPVGNGRLALGTWQGIFLCEHRRRASGRSIVLTLWGRRRV
ncbi:secondary thiamine-phosphate synthase enzyme YjbQ [Thermopirellula anaerolimosa]